MKHPGVAILFLFLVLMSLFSGCMNTSPSGHEKTHDPRLIGSWQNNRTFEILEFKADGTYTVTEGELAEWYTESGGRLWMFGTAYTYTLADRDTLLNITEQVYTRTYHRL